MLDSRDLEEEAVLAALMGISEMMGDLADIDELLDAIVRIAPRLSSATRCAIFLRNPKTRDVRVAHGFTHDSESTALLSRLAIAEADIPKLVHKLFDQKIPVMIREGREPMLPAPILKALRIRSMLLVPLAYQDQALGFLTVDDPGKDHVYTSREVNVVNAIATHAAVALVHARLLEAFRQERRRTLALAGALCDGIVSLDTSLRIGFLSPGVESLLGWRSDEVAGRSVGEALAADGEDIEALGRELLEGTRRVTGVFRFQSKSGRPVTCLVTGLSVPSGGNGAAEVVFALSKVDPERAEPEG